MHVKRRLGLMTGAAVSIFVLVIGSSYFAVSSLIQQEEFLTRSREVGSEFHNLLYRVALLNADEQHYALTGDKKLLAERNADFDSTLSSVDALKVLEGNNKDQGVILEAIRDLLLKRQSEMEANVQVDHSQRFADLQAAFEANQTKGQKERSDQVIHAISATLMSLLAGGVLSVGFVALFNFYFGRHITESVKQLLNAAENAENGRLVKVHIESDDEFGELGDAFNRISVSLDVANRKLKMWEVDNVHLSEVRPIVGPLDQTAAVNSKIAEYVSDVRSPVDSAVQRGSVIFRNTAEVRRLLNTTDENLSSLKTSIVECSEQADKLGGLQSELDNISNALEVISMSVDMAAPDGQPVLGAVMTRLHELSERCHAQRQTVGESLTRMQTLLSRAMLTTHASSGAEVTARQLLEGLTDTLDSLIRELEQCRSASSLVIESVATQAELLAACRTVTTKIAEREGGKTEVVKKLQQSLEQTIAPGS